MSLPGNKTKEFQLPSSKVKTIMKSSPEVESVSQDSLAVVAKATELFIQDLARRALQKGKPNKLEYCDVAEVVQNEDNLFFLKEIVPRKITVRQYKELMKKEGISDELSSSSSSSSSSESSEDDSDVEVIEDEDEESSGSEESGGEEEEEDGDDNEEETNPVQR